jgi:hypothetical protein
LGIDESLEVHKLNDLLLPAILEFLKDIPAIIPFTDI